MPHATPQPWPAGAGTAFREDLAFLCRGDDRRVYRVVRREQWVAVAGADGRRRWQRTGSCSYTLDDGRPVRQLDDGRYVVARSATVLTPL
ncbi:MAG: hypothetical protein QM702_25680 [Rubrivivax sp.]